MAPGCADPVAPPGPAELEPARPPATVAAALVAPAAADDPDPVTETPPVVAGDAVGGAGVAATTVTW